MTATTTDTATRTGWADRADIAQRSIDELFAAPPPQLVHNAAPFEPGDDEVFNYWWLAHLIDVRLDAEEREPGAGWLDRAREVHANILERNEGSLFNDYFDDMLWYALATLRLAAACERAGLAEAASGYRADAIALWDHVLEHGWNDQLGGSVAWRKQQPYYKNTPANGPFAILGARLATLTGDAEYRTWARRAFDWITANLVDAETGFVEDGVNREQDGAVDRHWRFTYNQGLYVGAAVALAEAGEPDADALVATAARTAATAIRELGDGTVFAAEGDGGDEGLFKGVFYRYLGTLLPHLPASEREPFEAFVASSTDALWATSGSDELLRNGNDWSRREEGKIGTSTLLSAVMAVELRAALER
jgi:predicted alpha-1,6-mannanase (GH76 family)